MKNKTSSSGCFFHPLEWKNLRSFTCEGRHHFSKCLLWYDLTPVPPKVLWVIGRRQKQLFQKRQRKKKSGKFKLLIPGPKRTALTHVLPFTPVTPDFLDHLEWRIGCSLNVAGYFGDDHSHWLHIDNLKGFTEKEISHWKPGLQSRKKLFACFFNNFRILTMRWWNVCSNP